MSESHTRPWSRAGAFCFACLSPTIPAVILALAARSLRFPIEDGAAVGPYFAALVASFVGCALAVIAIVSETRFRRAAVVVIAGVGVVLNLIVAALAFLLMIAVSFSGLRH
jgi:hypothetical protein